ncbi:hypothetical protein CLV63_10671 [Murinocardiopsis flavida]|uniref:Uncharacterized protein n=1 Tax=Murinocardiopsis flavida TaxID=645275 RepID=A0A2P8DLC7_9ACTN|nr:hypothetical protein [Murinocardiopsis flavida]PSK98023.1 hypothetical protein CLV63_10671 [Murinocardiopsis flavida]
MTERAGPIILALTLAAGVLTGCAQDDEGADAVRAGRTIPFELTTHCGIDEARIGSTYFEAETPLSDGSGNPPEGWDSPTQHGTMTLKSEAKAVFTDDAGHEVEFRARSDAREFKRICR